MGWNELDDKLKRKLDRRFVSCDEAYERKAVESVVMEHAPHLLRLEVQKAIRDCCAEVSAPRPRADFVKCLARRLGI